MKSQECARAPKIVFPPKPSMLAPRPALAVVNGLVYAVGGVHSSGGGDEDEPGRDPFTAQVERLEGAGDLHDVDGGSAAGGRSARWVREGPATPVAYHACFAAGLTPLYD